MSAFAATWLAECGCGGVITIQNAQIRRTKRCAACDDMARDFEQARVVAELEWCSCGNPEDVDAQMTAYLLTLAGDEFPRPTPVGVSADAAVLLAYICDDLGWAEHGTSIGGSWLTDAGRTALAELS